jgi:hypothetical protein
LYILFLHDKDETQFIVRLTIKICPGQTEVARDVRRIIGYAREGVRRAKVSNPTNIIVSLLICKPLAMTFLLIVLIFTMNLLF